MRPRSNRRVSGETVREEVLNVLLAEILRDSGMSARAERRSGGSIPDVQVELKSEDLVILECKWEGSESLLESQLNERLEQNPQALAIVGVLYPETLMATGRRQGRAGVRRYAPSGGSNGSKGKVTEQRNNLHRLHRRTWLPFAQSFPLNWKVLTGLLPPPELSNSPWNSLLKR